MLQLRYGLKKTHQHLHVFYVLLRKTPHMLTIIQIRHHIQCCLMWNPISCHYVEYVTHAFLHVLVCMHVSCHSRRWFQFVVVGFMYMIKVPQPPLLVMLYFDICRAAAPFRSLFSFVGLLPLFTFMPPLPGAHPMIGLFASSGCPYTEPS